jgi:streptogramin lyase
MKVRAIAALLAASAALALAAPAGAYVVESVGGLQSFTNGITLGPDGNFWVAEAGSGTVVRISPAGAVLGRIGVGSSPTSLAADGSKVWVSVTGAGKLVWIDATSAAPSAHDVPTGSAGDCGPVAVVGGGNGRIYFSLPDDGGGCTNGDAVGSVNSSGGDLQTTSGLGTVFDLAVSNGKLYAPDFNGDQVRRLSLASSPVEEDSFGTPPGGGADGIAADGSGNLWVTLYNGGAVSRITPGGTVTTLTPPSPLTNPFGIVAAADGNVYVTAQTSANLMRITPSGQFTNFPVGGLHQPWQIVNGTDGDLWFTDTNQPNVHHFVNSAPRAATGNVSVLSPTSASFAASVNSRGNDTQVVFDYGPTAAYGSSTSPVNVPAGTRPADVNAPAAGLPASSTLHVRVRAANSEGTVIGEDRTFTTPPLPPSRLAGSAVITWNTFRTYIVVRKITVSSLKGGERVTITCSKRPGCPYKKKAFKVTKKGKREFGKRFRHRKLRVGTRLRVTVSKPGFIGNVATVTVRRGKDPRFVRQCLKPGATKPGSC